jgi:hypothetical protein
MFIEGKLGQCWGLEDEGGMFQGDGGANAPVNFRRVKMKVVPSDLARGGTGSFRQTDGVRNRCDGGPGVSVLLGRGWRNRNRG